MSKLPPSRRSPADFARLRALPVRTVLKVADRCQSGLTLVRNVSVSAMLLGGVAIAVMLFVASSGGSTLAGVADNFEIDANVTSDAKAGYYAGIGEAADDWATTASVPTPDSTNDGLLDCQSPGTGVQPAFLLCNADRTDVPDCYGSKVVPNPNADGRPVLLCDGNSGLSETLQTEEDIISSFSGCSDQKTNDDRWCVKRTGVLNNPAKSDETHGYVVMGRQVECEDGIYAGEVHDFIVGGYERLGNEGTVFAGFQFYQVPPLEIAMNGNASLNYVDPTDSTAHFRTVGDILILLNQTGQDANMQFSLAEDDDGDPNTVPVFPDPINASGLEGNCGSTAVINSVSVQAPPWQGEFCDPTADPTPDDLDDEVGTPNNQCKVIANAGPGACSGPDRTDPEDADPDCPPGGTLVPDQDFVEWAIDLTAEEIEVDPCALTGVLMTSRSSDEFTADLKDVHNEPLPSSCDIGVVKDGDTLSKETDPVDYTIVISNPGEEAMYMQDITDSLLGKIVEDGADLGNQYVQANQCTDDPAKNPLQPGDSCTIMATRVVEPGDPNPLPNTVTVVYDSKISLDGFERTASDDHSVELFDPAIAVEKTGDTLSKVGDEVTYSFKLSNNSTPNTPPLHCTLADSLLGPITIPDPLPLGDTVIDMPHTIQPGDDAADGDEDGVVNNTVTLHCVVEEFGNERTAEASHSVEIFDPAITVEKTGDTLSKIGDDVTYNFKLSNNSTPNTPPLHCTLTDSLLGPITIPDPLPLGDTEINNVTHTIQPGDDAADGDEDGVVNNTVTLHCVVEEFGNERTAQASHAVELFDPAIAVEKTGDTLSKVGDEVTYNFKLSNNSTPNTPVLTCTATDSLLGIVFGPSVLPLGDTEINNVTYTIQPGDDAADGDQDGFVTNTVTLECDVEGFPNKPSAQASHPVELFDPAIDVEKTGDDLSKVGDEVAYNFKLFNNSTPNTPPLHCTLTDSLLGPITIPDPLPLGDTDINNVTHTIQPGDDAADGDEDGFVTNTVTLHCVVEEFGNERTAQASHSVELFDPAIDVEKTGDDLSKVGDEVTYNFKLSNSSTPNTPPLHCTLTDSLLGAITIPDPLPLGDTVIDVTHTIQPGDDAADGDEDGFVTNTVTLHCVVEEFGNEYTVFATHPVELFVPAIAVEKTGDDLSKVGDEVTYDFKLSNNSTPNTPPLHCTLTDSLLGAITIPDPLPLGDTEIDDVPYTIQPGDDAADGDEDGFVTNTVTLHCVVEEFGNERTAQASHAVELFDTAVTVSKTGDELSKVGDEVTYTIEVCNTGSDNSPDLIVDSVVDDHLGDLTVSYTQALGVDDCESHDFPYTVAAGDPDPLVNTVEVHYHPEGFPNDVEGSASHTLEVFQPALMVTCQTNPTEVRIGDADTYTFTFTITNTNTGSDDSPDLEPVSVDDSVLGDVSASFPDSLAPGESATVTLTRDVPRSDFVDDRLDRSVEALYGVAGFPNEVSASDSCPIAVLPALIPPQLPPTGGSGPSGDDISYVVLFAFAGAFLLGVSTWLVWRSRRERQV